MKILKRFLMFFVAAAVCGSLNMTQVFGAYVKNQSFDTAEKIEFGKNIDFYSSSLSTSITAYYSFYVPQDSTVTITVSFRCTKEKEDISYKDEFTGVFYTSSKSKIAESQCSFSKPTVGTSNSLTVKQDLNAGNYYFTLKPYRWIGDMAIYKVVISSNIKCLHSRTKDTQTKAPTCSSVGELETRCIDCKEIVSVQRLEKLEHTLPDAWETVTEPSCSAEGQRIKKCTVCGETAESETLDKLAHTYSDWSVSRAATCAADGENKRTCSVCGFVETEPIPALEHTFSEWKITKKETCADEGSREHTCTVCGKTVSEKTEKLDHSYGKWETVDAATCTKTGKRKRVCQNCGNEQTEVLEMTSHRYGAWKIITEATCQRSGEKKRTCSECNDTQTEKINQTGHDYSSWKTTQEPTEYSTGYAKRYCRYCNTEDKKTLAKLSHGEKTTWKTTVQPTCTSVGTAVEYCDYCNKSVGSKTLAKLGHNFGDWTVTKAATTTSEGTETRTCSSCRITESRSIAKLNIPGRSGFKSSRTYADKFTDVKKDSWFYNSVKTAYEYNLVNGMNENSFSPTSKFTVAQVLTVAATLHSAYYGTEIPQSASGEKWYQRYVKYCTDNKIITSAQFASYDVNINRGEMAQIFANVLPDSEYSGTESAYCPDVNSSNSYYNAVTRLYKAGIVTGDAETRNYRPNDYLTRAEACVIFTRIAVSDMRSTTTKATN